MNNYFSKYMVSVLLLFEKIKIILFTTSEFLINSKFLISFSALLFTISTPILLGINLHFYYFYILIFFSTLFEYNLHRIKFNDIFRNENILLLLLCSLSIIIVIVTCFFADFYIFILLIPFGLISIFYTIPFYKSKNNTINNSNILFRIKDLPYIKIFAISIVWSFVTTIPFIFKVELLYNKIDIYLLIIEKFLFIFAITLPFDIRDAKIDFQENIKTIPNLLDLKDHSLSIIIILILSVLQIIHYYFNGMVSLLLGLLISNLLTIFLLKNNQIQKNRYYYYGYLDGTILVQGLIVFIISLLD